MMRLRWRATPFCRACAVWLPGHTPSVPPPFVAKDPEKRANPGKNAKADAIRSILNDIRLGVPPDTACWIAEIDPEIFQGWMLEDRRLRHGVMKRLGEYEKELILKVQAGGPGLGQSRAALEILGRTFKRWSQKTDVTLVSALQDAVAELKKRLPPETLRQVLEILEKHS